jgi:hypothetical protein
MSNPTNDEAGETLPSGKHDLRPSWRREGGWMVALLGAYLVPVAVLPPRGDYALVDDWAHAMAVRNLLDHGRLTIPDWSAMTLVAQVGWGALFAEAFGFSFQTLRVSVLVLGLVAVVACYAICRELGVGPARAAAGALVLWFNPIMFSLSYTFMTDVPFAALLLASTFWHVRALRRGGDVDFLIGSTIAGLAFLVRQHGVLIPVAVLAYGVSARWPLRLLARRGLAIIGPAATMVLGYLTWSRIVGLPGVQDDHLRILLHDSSGALGSIATLAGYVMVYLGLFWLPLAGGAAAALVARRDISRRGLAWLLGWAAAITAAVVLFALHGRSATGAGGLVVYGHGGWMPYLKDGSMLTLPGIGPNDLRGERAVALHPAARALLTLMSAAAVVLLGAAFIRHRFPATRAPEALPAPLKLLLVIGVFQFLGVILVSVRLIVTSPDWLSFDRYLLPLAPLTIVLGLWATRDLRLSKIAVVAGLVAFALFSVTGTQDWLAANRVRWEMANQLRLAGVPTEKIDAGLEWDAWWLYGTPSERQTPDGPFWTAIAAPAVDSTFVIAFSPQPGYRTLERRAYPSWLHRRPVYLYLLTRVDGG